jgi:hypothetical protein
MLATKWLELKGVSGYRRIRFSQPDWSRIGAVELGVDQSTYGPTATLRNTLEIANAQLEQIISELEQAQALAAVL